jgi:hypothetical protein
MGFFFCLKGLGFNNMHTEYACASEGPLGITKRPHHESKWQGFLIPHVMMHLCISSNLSVFLNSFLLDNE